MSVIECKQMIDDCLFQFYIAKTIKKLRQTHPHANDELIYEIGPKQYLPKIKATKGVLLVHGLLDTCSSMNSLFDSFSNKDFIVKNVLLPGHGTTPDELLDVKYEEWLDCVATAIQSFEPDINDITIIALSAGATISFTLANRFPTIKRLVLFAPAFELTHTSAKLIPLLKKFNDAMPPIAKQWLVYDVDYENQKVKYQSITTNAVYQLMKLMRHINEKVKNDPVACPILTIVSQDDETISTSKAIEQTLSQPNPENKVIVYSNDNSFISGSKNIIKKTSCYPDQKILNYSHVGMHISPTHPRYGKKTNISDTYLGALTNKNMLNYPKKLMRLTFNPDYHHLLEIITHFISQERN